MKNAVIIHGKPGKEEYYQPAGDSESNSHWLPWLQKQLIINSVLAETPEMPKPYEPSYESWLEVLQRYPLNEDTILVGHSCGGGFLIRWLSENDVKVGKVILVAPWINLEGKASGNGMFEGLQIDPGIEAKTTGVTVFASDNDYKPMHTSLAKLKQVISNLSVREFHNYGHFRLKDMQTREFPELLEECLT